MDGSDAQRPSGEPPDAAGQKRRTKIVTSHIGGVDEGDPFEDAQALARAFGAPVFVPTQWPRGVGSPRYLLSILDPSGPAIARHYRVVADSRGGAGALMVRGALGTRSQRADTQGWFAVPELDNVDGVARTADDFVQVVVQRDFQQVHLIAFPTLEDAVVTALSLRRISP